MKEYRTAIILIASATVLAGAAYMIFRTPQEIDHSTVTNEVSTEVVPPVKAPDWVNKTPEASPDYQPAETKPVDTTPPAAPVVETKSDVVEITEDKIVTFTFAESLADYLLHRFEPRNTKGKPASTASLVTLNKYYGRELEGFAVSDDDINSTRKSVLNYAFTPSMLKTLYDLYAKAFIVHLVDTAANTERDYKVAGKTEHRVLTNDEIQAMLRINARKIERAGDLFRAVAEDKDITEVAAKYRRAAKAVERANGQLQTAMSEEKNTNEASDRLKKAILLRENAKAEIISHMKQVCQSCPESELFYLSQWAYRRVLNDQNEKLPTFGVAADIMDDLAKRFTTQADALK